MEIKLGLRWHYRILYNYLDCLSRPEKFEG